MGLFSRNKTLKPEQVAQNPMVKNVEIAIEKDNIRRITSIKNQFSQIEGLFSIYERLMFLKSAESSEELKNRMNLLETATLNLRGRMDEVQEIAAKIEASLLASRKSDLENRDKHLAMHEKEVLDYVYSIDKIIDKLVEQIRSMRMIDYKKTVLTEKMPKDTEPHKLLAKHVATIKKSIEDLNQKIIQLYNFEEKGA